MERGMEEFFQSLNLANQWEDWLKALLLWLLLGLPPTVALLGAIYSLVALPLWRRDRAQLFLDLLETGLNSGQSAESALAAATAVPDRSLGRHLRRLGAALREGRR